MEMALVNPRRRSGRRHGRSHRTAAQRAATKRMIAARWGSSRKRHTARRHNPVYLSNPSPRRRRRSSAMRSITHHGHSVSRAAWRRSGYRRNPARRGFDLMGMAKNTLVPGAIGGVGAVGLDMILDRLPLPATLTFGPMRPVVKFAGAIGLGILAGMITNRRIGEQVAIGAIAVSVYDLVKGFMPGAMMVLPAPSAAAAAGPVGAYLEGLGYTSPAVQLGEYIAEDERVYA